MPKSRVRKNRYRGRGARAASSIGETGGPSITCDAILRMQKENAGASSRRILRDKWLRAKV